jgi:hypothetical protein
MTSTTPILDGLLAAGDARLDGTTIVGRASDGTEVMLGVTFNTGAAERYLRDFPTPDTW